MGADMRAFAGQIIAVAKTATAGLSAVGCGVFLRPECLAPLRGKTVVQHRPAVS